MTSARDRILGRLKSAPRRTMPERPDWTPPRYGEGRMAQFRAMLEAAHADVREVTRAEWPERLRVILADKGVTQVLFAPATETGRRLAEAWAIGAAPRLVAYDRAIEAMKPVLVHEVQAAVTTARGGIAQTGSLVLWPTPDEPRLMSLLPPIHVVLVDKTRIADSLADTMADEAWAAGMPTNAVLVSGPSKTADIEQTLAYGVHGPKELIVLVIGDGQ
ncbi:MAG: lactate utilization protein [Magnetospirillum sp.]|nr:MAG: lactate utilization protein [Magnetospirillum sp.]